MPQPNLHGALVVDNYKCRTHHIYILHVYFHLPQPANDEGKHPTKLLTT